MTSDEAYAAPRSRATVEPSLCTVRISRTWANVKTAFSSSSFMQVMSSVLPSSMSKISRIFSGGDL